MKVISGEMLVFQSPSYSRCFALHKCSIITVHHSQASLINISCQPIFHINASDHGIVLIIRGGSVVQKKPLFQIVAAAAHPLLQFCGPVVNLEGAAILC